MKRTFWMLMLLSAFAGATYQVATVFIQYYRYEVTVSKTFTYQRQAIFPAVTFCNMNPVKRTAASGNSQLSTLTSQQTNRKRRQARNNVNDDFANTKIHVKFRHKRSSMFVYAYLYWYRYTCICKNKHTRARTCAHTSTIHAHTHITHTHTHIKTHNIILYTHTHTWLRAQQSTGETVLFPAPFHQ